MISADIGSWRAITAAPAPETSAGMKWTGMGRSWSGDRRGSGMEVSDLCVVEKAWRDGHQNAPYEGSVRASYGRMGGQVLRWIK